MREDHVTCTILCDLVQCTGALHIGFGSDLAAGGAHVAIDHGYHAHSTLAATCGESPPQDLQALQAVGYVLLPRCPTLTWLVVAWGSIGLTFNIVNTGKGATRLHERQ
jgi:hypothetical protein